MEQYNVKLTKIRFQGEDLYTIAEGKAEEEIPEKYRNKGLIHGINLKGYFPRSMSSQYLMFGSWNKTDFGFTFCVSRYEEKIALTKEGIVSYLTSSINGIGPALSKKIYQKFGNKTLEVFDADPQRLLEVKGITEKKLKKMVESYKASHIMRDLLLLCGESISLKLCGKLYKEYGDDAINIIRNNPYKLCDISGISFLTADKVARSVHSDPAREERVEAAIFFVLEQAQGKGHVCLPQKELLLEAESLLNHDFEQRVVSRGQIVQSINQLASSGCLKGDNGFAYLKTAYEDEISAAFNVCKLIRRNKKASSKISEIISEVEQEVGITLHEQQREAVQMIAKNNFCVVTGGPGTGKSTILKLAIKVMQKLNKSLHDEDFLLVAPTGKAARRMAETTDYAYTAQTIHSALHLYKNDDEDDYSGLALIPQKIVFCDEASMIDSWLFSKLLAGTKDSQLILLGDPEQLPSVGAGDVLADLLRCDDVPKVRLSKIYRQQGTSNIIINAQKIKYGDFQLEYRDDFRFYNAQDEEKTADLVVKMFEGKQLSKEQLSEIQILCPLKKKNHAAGSMVLNERLQEIINPYSAYKNQIKYGATTFRVGDKVMQMKNREEVNNGDTGFITTISGDEVFVDFGFAEVTYDKTELGQISLAYAISIHKSQGSEYETCIIPVTMSMYVMLYRNLIYTGITRAKKNVILVGDKNALRIAVSNNKQKIRYTQLDKRIQKLK